jgi:hypothetical protein
VVGLSILGAVLEARAAEEPTAEWQRLQQENAGLRLRSELAGTGKPYLVLDAAGGRLRFMNGATVLRDYPLVEAQIGTPRAVFFSLDAGAQWRGRIWAGGVLDPAPQYRRVEITAPAPGTPAPPTFIPEEPAAALPAPPRYVLRFPGGLTLEVQDGSSGPGLRERIADLVGALRAVGSERVPRLRITLAPEAAGALYRSLPAETALLVM